MSKKIDKPDWWRPGIHPEGTVIGCLNCGVTEHVLPMDTRLYNGFGGWTIFRDGEVFFCEDASADKEWEEWKTLAEIEKDAAKEPARNWIAEVFLPLRGAIYQRHFDDGWILVETNMGFA